MSVRIFIFLLFILFVIGCNDESSRAVINSKDSLSNTKELADQKVIDSSQDNQELSDIINGYIRMYDKSIYIDSSYIIAKDTFRITIKHYCLKDSSIIVPKKYVEVYKLHSFITHNFSSKITFEKNGLLIFEQNITKKDFENYLEPNLKNYGVLLYPEVENMNRVVKINYSISIPLTDIGTSVSVVIDNEGKINFRSK